MKIKINDIEIKVTNMISDILRKGAYTYPALKFILPDGISSSDIESLLSGSFDILDDNDQILMTYEGFNVLKEVSVTIGKITTAEQQVIELSTQVDSLTEKNTEYQEKINSLEVENANLLFNNLTSGV